MFLRLDFGGYGVMMDMSLGSDLSDQCTWISVHTKKPPNGKMSYR